MAIKKIDNPRYAVVCDSCDEELSDNALKIVSGTAYIYTYGPEPGDQKQELKDIRYTKFYCKKCASVKAFL